MEKVTDFLERYVQWVALGIAVLFLGFAVYSYMPGLATPVVVDVKGEAVSPGEADDRVLGEIAKPLEDEINSTKPFPTINVPAYGTQVRDRLSAPSTRPTLVTSAFGTRSVELPPDINWNVVPNRNDVDASKVRQLPTLPAAILAPDPTTGFAQVDPNQANGTNPTAVGAAGGAAGPGGAAAPAAATAAGAPAANGAGTQDVVWVRVPFTIPTQQLLAAFRAVNLPQDWSKTTVLHVDLIRQKQLADGNWSPEELVAALPINKLDPMPADNAGQPAQQAYSAYAITHESEIIQPAFYHVLAGDDPTLERPVLAPEVDATTFDPTHYPAGTSLRGLTQDQIAQVVKYRNQAEAERRQQQQQPQQQPRGTRRPTRATGGGAAGGEGGGGGGGGTRQPQPQPQPRAPRPNPAAQPNPTAAGEGAAGNGMGSEATPAYQPPPPGAPIQLTQVPQAPFSPGEVGNDVQGVAYDITATSEATYRYRIRYSAANPIFGSQNVAEPAALALKFALIGEDANTWSTPVTIAPLTHIFLAQAPRSGTLTRFNVFRWAAGRWQSSNATAASGDSIGKVENGTDFRTPWTLVEVRNDSSSPNNYVLLMNADGTLRRQEYEKDSTSTQQMQLKAQADAAAAQQAAPGGVPGATPAGPAGPGGPGGARPGMPPATPRGGAAGPVG